MSLAATSSFTAPRPNAQGEIDVIGFQIAARRVRLCEVATHLDGLLYSSGNADTLKKIRQKTERAAKFAASMFDGHEAVIEWWSPKASPILVAGLQHIQAEHRAAGTQLEFVVNETYSTRVCELMTIAARTESDPRAALPRASDPDPPPRWADRLEMTRNTVDQNGDAGQVPVARLHLRSTVDGVDHVAIEDWCIGDGGDGWAGVGWGLWEDDSYTGISFARYTEIRASRGETVSDSVQRLHQLPIGALMWSPRRDSSYWLGELTGPWRYRDGAEAQALDMFNVRPCRWWRVGTQDVVPGKVVNNFSARVTLIPVKDPGAVRYTRRLHAQYVGLGHDLRPTTPVEVMTSLLGPTDLEDLVAVYLQDQHHSGPDQPRQINRRLRVRPP